MIFRIFRVEEAVGLTVVEEQFAADSEFSHRVPEVLRGGDWDEIIVCSEKYDGRRSLRSEVVEGREGLPVGFDSVVAVAAWAVVEDGVIEHECIGSGGNSGVVVGIVEGCEGGGGGCNLSTGGTAACGNPLGIDPEGFCMGSDVTDGGFAIIDAFSWGGAVRFCGSILRGNGDHSALGEVPALRVEL